MLYFSLLSGQAKWVDSEGETSYIFIKEQYDSLLAQSDKIQENLDEKIIQLNLIQKEFDFCTYNSSQRSTSNYLLEQSIPTKSENYWLWVGAGIIGGFSLCQLLNL